MTLQPLLEASPAIQLHAFAAIAAFALGAAVLFRRKGDRLHRLGGRIWVGLMLVVTLSSFFIHTIRMWGPWSPIHLLSIGTLLALAWAVYMIRRRNIVAHAATMKATYLGALVIAGGFTLLPGRIMHAVVFGAAQASAPVAPANMPAHEITALDIVTHTPLWVWPILGYVVFVGIRRMRGRMIAPWRLLILPAVAATLAFAHLFSGDPTATRFLAFASGAALGALAGLVIARRRPACLREDGLLEIAGDWMPLVLMLGIFSVRYAQGIALGIHPELAGNLLFLLASNAAPGLFMAMMIARTFGALPKELFRRMGFGETLVTAPRNTARR